MNIRLFLIVAAVLALILDIAVLKTNYSYWLFSNPFTYGFIALALVIAFLIGSFIYIRRHGQRHGGGTTPPILAQPRGGGAAPPRPPVQGEWQPDWEPWKYYSLWLAEFLIIYLIAIFAGRTGGTWYEIDFKLFAILSVITHFALSFARKVDKNEVGAVFFFGKPKLELGPGLVLFVPWLVAELATVEQEIIQIISGTETRDRDDKPVERVPEEHMLILRETTPQRISFGHVDSSPGAYPPGKDPVPDHAIPDITPEVRERLKKDPLNQRLTCDPQIIIELEIARAVPFFQKVGDTRKLAKMISEVAMGALQETAGRIPAGLALEWQDIVEKRITRKIEELVGEKPIGDTQERSGDWGINFRKLQIKTFGFPHSLNKQIAAANAAGFESNATRIKSEGERERELNLGWARAVSVGWEVEERGRGLREIADVASQGPNGELAVRTEALQKAVQGAKATFISQDLNAITGGAAILADALQGRPALPSSGEGQSGPTPPQPPQTGGGGQPRGQRPRDQRDRGRNRPNRPRPGEPAQPNQPPQGGGGQNPGGQP